MTRFIRIEVDAAMIGDDVRSAADVEAYVRRLQALCDEAGEPVRVVAITAFGIMTGDDDTDGVTKDDTPEVRFDPPRRAQTPAPAAVVPSALGVGPLEPATESKE